MDENRLDEVPATRNIAIPKKVVIMNLTPEERQTGIANFNRVVGDNIQVTRRDFIQTGVLTGLAAGGSLGAFYFGYESTLGKPIRVAVLGTGDEGQVLIGACNPEFVEIVAIADIRPYNVHRAFHGDHYSEAALAARPGLMGVYGWKTEDEARKHVRVYGPYEELLENEKDNIDGVIIGLPLHLHAPAAIAAMKAGKHVLCEKLMAQRVSQCKDMARLAKQAGLHLAIGHQRHYNILYENAADTIRRGLLGELHYIRAQWHRGNLPGNDSWAQPLPPGSKPDDVTGTRLIRELESYKRSLAEAEKAGRMREAEKWAKLVAQKAAQIADKEIIEAAKEYGYEDKTLEAGDQRYFRPAIEELIRWRLWDRTGAGLMAELGSHQLDAASIFIAAAHDGKKQSPLNVAAAASRSIFPADRDVEDHVYCIFEFPAPGYDPRDPAHGAKKKIGVQYSSINGNGFGGYGEIVHGTNGGFVLEREQTLSPFKGAEVQGTVSAGPASVGPTLDTQASAAVAVAGATAGPVSRGYREELEHWAWCIRNRSRENMPRCHPEVALADAVIALTANKAAREGRRIDFKKEWFDIDSNQTPDDSEEELKRYGV